MKYYTVEELQTNQQISELNNKGVYVMKCLATNEEYVGSTTRDFRARWKEIRKHCRNDNRKISKLLRQYWSKYGDEQFVFGILEITENPKLAEQYWINKLQPAFNQRPLVSPYIEAKPSWKSKANTKYGYGVYKQKLQDERKRRASIIKAKLLTAKVKPLNPNIKKMWVLSTDNIKLKFSNLKAFCEENDINYSWFRRIEWLADYGISLQYVDLPSKHTRQDLLMKRIKDLRNSLDNAVIPQDKRVPRWCIETSNRKFYVFSLHAFCVLNNITKSGLKTLPPQYEQNGVKISKLF